MATMTKTRKQGKGKQPRSVRIGAAVEGVRNMVIADAQGVRTGYELRELAVDFGRGFELTKFEMEQADADDRVYHVHLDAELGNSCTCKGATYRPERGCKHLDAVAALVKLGKL